MTVVRFFFYCGLLTILGCQPADRAAPEPTVQGAPIDSPAQSAAGDSPAQSAVSPTPPANSSGALSPVGQRIAPTDPTERAKLAVDAPQPKAKPGYSSVSFAELSDFIYQTDINGKLSPDSHLPQKIQELNEAPVAVSGFLMPIEFKGDKVSTLILVRNQLLCCFGEEPKLNEWIFVNIDPPVPATTDVPVTLYGTFYASPDIEEGQVISLYRMQASEMEAL